MSKRRSSSLDVAATVIVPLTGHQLAQFDRWAERAFTKRGELAAKIIAAWLDNPARELIAGQVPCDLGSVCQAHHEQLRHRQRIVLAWRAAIDNRRQRESIDRATRSFLAKLKRDEGILISRATLFNWFRAYKGSGLPGLADQRRAGGKMIDQSSFEAGSLGVQKGSNCASQHRR